MKILLAMHPATHCLRRFGSPVKNSARLRLCNQCRTAWRCPILESTSVSLTNIDRLPCKCPSYNSMPTRHGRRPQSNEWAVISLQCWSQIKSNNNINQGTASKQSEHVGGIISMSVKVSGLHVHARFAIPRYCSVDVLLSTSFTDSGIPGILPSERKVESWHSRPVSILPSSATVSSLFSDTFVLNAQSTHAAKPSEVNNDTVGENFTFVQCFIKTWSLNLFKAW